MKTPYQYMRLNQEVLLTKRIKWRRIEALSRELGIPEKTVYKYTYDCRKYMERLTAIYDKIAANNNGKLFKITKVKPGEQSTTPQSPYHFNVVGRRSKTLKMN